MFPSFFKSAAKVSQRRADSLSMNTISSSLPSLVPASATSSGLAAISTAQQELSQDASQIANPDSPPATQSLLNLQQSSALNGAAADVIDTSNQMMGTLLNVFA
jgi:hypothetical protein